MNIRNHIDVLFSDYQGSSELDDFKEELYCHLDERIKILTKKGMDESSAVNKALSELGNISQVADEISKKKKQEVLLDMYAKTRNYISAKRSALYATCGLLLGIAILLPMITWLSSSITVGAVSTSMPFGMLSILGFLFLGLTQETASHEGMSWKRALWYVLAVGFVLFGIFTAFITYFGVEFASLTEYKSSVEFAKHMPVPENASLMSAISVLMVFSLPGMALSAFLILTEKDRSKPWVAKMRLEAIQMSKQRFGNPARQEQFGLISGALWIGTIAGTILIIMTFGIEFSWLAIIVALIVQLIVIAMFTKSN